MPALPCSTPPSSSSSADHGLLRLAQGYRLVPAKRSLSGPCGLIPVNELGLAILGLCNGTLDVRGIEGKLREQLGNDPRDLEEFVRALKQRGWISCD